MQESINTQSMLKVGTILRGTYRIDSYLSSGGFGNTYVATNIEFDERVAIKEFFMKGVTQREDNQTIVSVSNTENANSFLEQKEKFKKEARRIRQLKNEHIVAVHDLFEENGTAYYVMDYVEGENLADALKRTGEPMSEQQVLFLLPQILDALKTIHNAGIWHLDLKPANIMVDKSGNVKLIDFGASKQLNAQKGGATTSTAISYTNGYAPREQMEQNYDKFGPWTDIYALGATLYNLLTNKRPLLPSDIDDDDSSDKHQSLPFPASVSDGMKNLVLQLMHTNRKLRPQGISDVLPLLDLPSAKSEKVHKKSAESNLNETEESEETIIATPQNEETILEKKKDPKPEQRPTSTPVVNTESSSNAYNNVEGGGFGKTIVIIGIVAIILILIIWNNSSTYSNYESNTPTETSTNNNQPQTGSSSPSSVSSGTNTNATNDLEIFQSKMRSCDWYTNTSSTYYFKYPDFMMPSTYYVDDSPGEVVVYSWKSVQLCYWPLLGGWAIDIANKGGYISNKTKVASVTYSSPITLIYSGYTDDGRIYYLRTKPILGGDVPQTMVLALIYPPEFKDHMSVLTDIVRHW